MAADVRFTETMCGWLAPLPAASHEEAERAGESAGAAGRFTLHVITPSVNVMVADPDHRNPAFGVVECAALHPQPLAVTYGHLDLFADAAPGVLHMRYRLDLVAPDGARFVLRGIKEVVRRAWFPTATNDTTTLFVDIFEGAEMTGSPRLRGIFRMGVGGVLAQGLSFRGRLGAIVRYLRYYVARCVAVYLGARRAPLRPEWAAQTGR
jgi:cholesterol oxidase